MANKDLNRLKFVLVEQKKTAKWLSGEIGKDPATVSKSCTNIANEEIFTIHVQLRGFNLSLKRFRNGVFGKFLLTSLFHL